MRPGGAVGRSLRRRRQRTATAPRERPGWPCVGRPDPVYVRTAEATGGQVFLFDKSEIGESAALMIASRAHDGDDLPRLGLARGRHARVLVPIDSTVESAMISVSLQCLQVADDHDAVGRESPRERSRRGLPPVRGGPDRDRRVAGAGAWKVTVSGRGMFFLVVQAKTTLDAWTSAIRRARRAARARGAVPGEGATRRGSARLLEVDLHGAAQRRGVAVRVVTGRAAAGPRPGAAKTAPAATTSTTSAR